jgi:hypothetical protein
MVTPSPTLLFAFIHVYTLSYSPACFYSWLNPLLLSCLLLFMGKPSPALLLAFIYGFTLSYSPACFSSWLHPLLLSCLLLFMVTPSPTLLFAFINVYSLSYSPACLYSWLNPPPSLACFYSWLHPLLLSCLLLFMVTHSPTLRLPFIHVYTLSYSPACF